MRRRRSRRKQEQTDPGRTAEAYPEGTGLLRHRIQRGQRAAKADRKPGLEKRTPEIVQIPGPVWTADLVWMPV